MRRYSAYVSLVLKKDIFVINCPDCSREISFYAPICPHCGYSKAKYEEIQTANSASSYDTPSEPVHKGSCLTSCIGIALAVLGIIVWVHGSTALVFWVLVTIGFYLALPVALIVGGDLGNAAAWLFYSIAGFFVSPFLGMPEKLSSAAISLNIVGFVALLVIASKKGQE